MHASVLLLCGLLIPGGMVVVLFPQVGSGGYLLIGMIALWERTAVEWTTDFTGTAPPLGDDDLPPAEVFPIWPERAEAAVPSASPPPAPSDGLPSSDPARRPP